MAIQIIEVPESRRISSDFEQSSTTLEFYGRKSFDEGAMFTAFLAACPTFFGGIPFKSLEIQPIGGGHWTASAQYSTKGVVGQVEGQGADVAGGHGSGTGSGGAPATPAAPGQYTPLTADYSWDISTYTEKITQSKVTISRTPLGGIGLAPDNKNAIGITQDGEVLGCDRISPKLEFSVTKTLGFITLNYLLKLKELVGKTNDDTFYGFGPTSVLFLGAQGRPKDGSSVTITYKFEVAEALIDIEICEDLVVPVKGGHDFLWVSYRDSIDENQLTKQPDGAYVEQIYDEADFKQLGIGH